MERVHSHTWAHSLVFASRNAVSRYSRRYHHLTLLIFVLAMTAPAALAAGPNTWSSTGGMNTPRVFQRQILLQTGEVLAAGGCSTFFCDSSLASAELYDPSAGTWSTTGSMTMPRTEFTASLLDDGRVLAAGGCNTSFLCTGTNTAELYDPATGLWTATGSMNAIRDGHVAVVLKNGKVLVAGGIGICNSQVCNTLASAEIYDPQTGSWTPTGDMTTSRIGHTATLLPGGRVLVTGGCASTGLPCSGGAALGAEVYDPTSGTWTATGPMVNGRTDAVATELLSGAVLVSGGLNGGGFTLSSAELYDPSTGLWTATGNMNAARFGNMATLLGDGQVLASGADGSAELYDPANGLWTSTGSMSASRSGISATALPNGTVLAAGGCGGNPCNTAEVYDPGSTPLVSFTPTTLNFGLEQVGLASAAQPITVTNRGSQTLNVTGVVLGGAQPGDYQTAGSCLSFPVLPGTSCTIQVSFAPTAFGDRSANLSIEDNAPNSPQVASLDGFGFLNAPFHWMPAGTMQEARQSHSSTRLVNGKVLVAGGQNLSSGTLASSEIFDPATGVWTNTGQMANPRVGHTATLLQNGLVLVAGGGTNTAELYNPTTGVWKPTGSLSVARSAHTAVLLSDGTALVVGGCSGQPCTSAEIYDPVAKTWTLTGSMSSARVNHTATRLADGTVLVAGGASGSGSLATAELYDPTTRTWKPTGNMAKARDTFTATLLANGKVLVAGGESFSDTNSLAAAELYDPNSGTWSATAHMHTRRFGHTATRLSNGQVLVSGGTYFCDPEFGFCFATPSAELYEPNAGQWLRVGNLIVARTNHRATLLLTGEVLDTGGYDPSNVTVFSSAELYRP